MPRAHVAEVGRIDDAQHLVGQGHVFENFVGQPVDTFALRAGQVLHPQNLLGHGRKIAGAPHAPQQEIEGRAGRCIGRGTGVVFWRVDPLGQGLGHVCGAREAQGRVACQGAVHQGPQVVVYGVSWVGGQHQVVVGHAVNGAVGVCFGQQGLAQQHFGQYQPGTEHVAHRSRCLTSGGFGRQVTGCADHAEGQLCRGGVVFVIARANGQAKVGDFGVPASIQQDVGGLQVAVHHPLLVRGFECAQDLQHCPDGTALRDATRGLDVLCQRRAADVFQHQTRAVFVHVGFVQRDDVRVHQPTQAAGLQQPLLGLGWQLAICWRVQQLECHFALQQRVVCQPDCCLGPSAQQFSEFEPSQRRWGSSHGLQVCRCGHGGVWRSVGRSVWRSARQRHKSLPPLWVAS